MMYNYNKQLLRNMSAFLHLFLNLQYNQQIIIVDRDTHIYSYIGHAGEWRDEFENESIIHSNNGWSGLIYRGELSRLTYLDLQECSDYIIEGIMPLKNGELLIYCGDDEAL